MPSIFTRRQRTFFQGEDGPQYDKFSTKNKPSKRMFRWLFESIGFLKESADTAQTDVQGFVQLSKDNEASVRNSTADASGYSKVARVHQLPHVIADSNVDDPDNNGNINNKISVRSIVSNYSRTGGQGITYIIKNIMEILSDIPFLVISQSNPGENATIGLNNEAFDTAISNSQSFQYINNTISIINNTVSQGYLGEIKMYSFFNEQLGDVNCEFDVFGVGRAENTFGASGKWSGWVILKGQARAVLEAAPYNASATILDRICDGANLVTTAQKYPTGIHSTSGENAGFDSVGANTHTLALTETPLKSHTHNLGANADISITSSGEHKHSIRASEDLAVGESLAALRYDPNGKDSALHEAWTGYDNLSPGVDQGAHVHEAADFNIGGTTESQGNSSAIAHNNRPLSFVVCYAMYIGTDGSTI